MNRPTILRNALCLLMALMCSVTWAQTSTSKGDALAGDGMLRFYRLAIPVTWSAYEQDLGGDYKQVLAFWQECENYVNRMFVPLGFCFDVVEDERLVMSGPNLIEENIYNAPSFGTELLDEAIGTSSYDVGMWVVHRDVEEENSGLSKLGGAYDGSTKGSGYAKTDKWVVAHELGHMFGAHHTAQGEGSLMDDQGEYFSYPSIKTIRSSARGSSSYKNVEVENSAPQFDAGKMQSIYQIPEGACLAIEVQATDSEGHKLMYTAIGCNSSNVDDINGDDGMMPVLASSAPQENLVISYSPVYTADLFYDDFFYAKEGTDVHAMAPGTYNLSILVNDVPSTAWSYEALDKEPFYSTYAIWEAQVQIVGGTPFRATLSPAKDTYTAGEEVTISWGVNKNYFTENATLRITLSTDYGKTYGHVLAQGVSAHDGACTVTMPNVAVTEVDVDFTTAVRKMKGGIIKLEEIDGAAFTLTMLDPTTDRSFTITTDNDNKGEGDNGNNNENEGDDADGIKTPESSRRSRTTFDLQGRRVANPTGGIHIIDGTKVLVSPGGTHHR